MKLITATMAKNLSNQLKDQPVVSATMEKILLTSLQGGHEVYVPRAGMATEQWESIHVFFLGLGYTVTEVIVTNSIRMKIKW